MKYTPSDCFMDVFSVDYKSLLNNGYDTVVFDLDNTLAKYTENIPNEQIQKLMNNLKQMGFRIYIISNNTEKRVTEFINNLQITNYLSLANKPLKRKLKKFIKNNNIEANKTIGIGDQLLTDIKIFNHLGLYSILVKTIDFKAQKWYTKINRLREKRIIKKITKENPTIGDKINQICQNA